MEKTGFKRIVIFILAALLCACPVWQTPADAEDACGLTVHSELSEISQYGNVRLMTDRRILLQDLENAGIEYGDIVTVSFLDQAMAMPVVREFSEAPTGSALMRIKEDAIELAINMGDFASEYIAGKSTSVDGTIVWTYKEGIEGPVTFCISLWEKGGLYDEADRNRLSYTDERSDYPDLSDEAFANFRAVTTTGMGENNLCRTSSPLNPRHKRNTFADAALKRAGIATIINLADSKEIAEGYEDYDESYYSSVSHIELRMSMSFDSDDFRIKLADGLRFFAENEGPYAVCCNEGKARTGVVAALLECFMGATYEEVISDFMTSYYNYYGITPDDSRYDVIANDNIIKILGTMFDTEDLQASDLSKEAEEYLREIGLSDPELGKLRANLGKTRSASADRTGKE